MSKLFWIIASLLAYITIVSCAEPVAPVTNSPSPLSVALTQNGYFFTLDAINKAGGLDIYREDGAEPRTIFAPTQSAWTNLAIALGYPTAPALINQLPPEVLKALLQYNCLRTPVTAANLGASSEWTTCFNLGGFYVPIRTTVNFETNQSVLALRDAACHLITIARPDIVAGNSILHGTFGLAVGPGMFDIVSMLLSNPFSRLEIDTFGNEGQNFFASLYDLTQPFTFFVPTLVGLQEAIVDVGPTGLGLLPEQITTLLQYQVASTKVETTTFGDVSTLAPGRTFSIDSASFPPAQETISTESLRTPVQILQADNISSDGHSIYCIGKVLFPAFPGCESNQNAAQGDQFCQVAATSPEECAAIKIETYNAGTSVSACAYTPQFCVVDVGNEAFNCSQYGAAAPITGSVCNNNSDYCVWTPGANPGVDPGSCDPVGGTGNDAIRCDEAITGTCNDPVSCAANCNSVKDPEFSMCVYVDATCDADPAAIQDTCPLLNNTDCVSLEGSTAFNGEFCAQTTN